MKTLRLLILDSLLAATVCQAQITDPGWFEVQSPDEAVQEAALQSQQFQDNGQNNSPPQPANSVAEAITPQIQALADGLQDDPVRIFDYVHDHIKFVLYFGSKKGAELTLLEKSGNEFDQCALLVALLSAAGYSNNVQYQFGWQEIPYDDPYANNHDLHHWWQLTLNNSGATWTNTANYVANLASARGYPHDTGGHIMVYQDTSDAINGYTNNFLMQRTWVALTISSTTYLLDPAFKISLPVTTLPGFSLTNAMGSTTVSNDLLSVAGGTANGNYVQNLVESAVRNKLTTYATNLLNYIQNNAPTASLPDLLGGWQIVPANNPVDYTTTLRFPSGAVNGMSTVGWTYEPTNLMSTLSVAFAGTNHQWYIPQLQGQRLSLVFSNNGMAQLWQDDTLLAQRATSGSGTTNVVVSVTHPIGTWNASGNTLIYNPTNFANQTVTNAYQSANATYGLLYGFEPDWGWLQQRQTKLDAYLQQGFTNGTRQVTSETLNIMGLNWLLQTAQLDQLLAPQLGMLPQNFHRIGRMAQESGHGYYVDVYMQDTGEYPSGGSDAAHLQLRSTSFDLWSVFSSALEHGLIEQLQSTNIVGASTVKMLEIASTNGQAVYLASSTNWTAGYGVKSHLTSYDTTTLNNLYSKYISQGYYVLMPANGSNHVISATGSWAGYGCVARQAVNGQAAFTAMLIAGGYFGAYSGGQDDSIDSGYVGAVGDNQANSFSQAPATVVNHPTADPVDTADGTFQVEATDLSLGQAEPRGITLSRYYNGTRRASNPAGMADGWIHNYCITANNVPAPQAGLGGATPALATPMLAATAAAIALYNGGQPDPKNWLTTALIAKWGVDQLTKNGVSVNLGKDTLQFVQQPNGVFTPPAGFTGTLTQTNSAFSLLMRHGNRFNFNTNGLLSTIVDQYNNTLSLAYTNGTLKTVSDWQGRTLTFNYTGSQLTSVGDGTRSVGYGYSAPNAQGDLTSFTDAEGQTCHYVYDTNHQMIATWDALSQMVVSNVYDAQGHVSAQYTQGQTNKTWHIYWTGWQTTEIDPAGGEQVYYYDDQSRLVAQQDALGNTKRMFYDGQNHVVATISPLNETNQFFYDGNNNLTNSIDALGHASQFIYDGQNNLLCAIDPNTNATTFGYNAQFSLVGQTNGAGDWVAYTYNLSGAHPGTLATRTDSGGMTQYGYDGYGQLNSIVHPGSLGSESFVNSALGDVTNHVDGRGFATGFQYNNRRQLTNSIAPTNLTVQVSFDANGNAATVTDARKNTASSTWSPTRHLLVTTLPATPQGVPVTTNGYDVRDWLANSADALGKQTFYNSDLAGRLVSVTDPVQRTATFGYDNDGRGIASTNAARETARKTWDARGSLLQLTDGASHVSTRGYDAAGNQRVLTNRNGNAWQFYFDQANRLTLSSSPLGYSNAVVFNHQGLPASTQDRLGQPTAFGYDAKGRLTNRNDNVASTFYSYDANDNLTNISETLNSNPSSINFSYDAYNRMQTYQDANGNLLQYRYDANGNLTNLIYPGGRNVFYAFDALNRMTNVTDWAGRKSSIGYDLDGRVTAITRPNGSYRTIAYDAAGQATNIMEQMSNSLPIAIFKYNWNTAAEMQWEFAAPLPHTTGLPTRTMTYDADNRLKTFQGPTMGSAQNVGVDANANLTYAPLINDTFTNYSFDPRNRLLSAGGVTNAYDAANNRIGQTYGANTMTYVVNPNAKLPQVLMRIKNGATNYYIYGAGLLYQITETTSGTNTLTYHYDYRGSTIALSTDNGLVTDRIEYSLYATLSYRVGTNDTPFLFNGRFGVISDPNGLLYMRARFYNPYLSRFINADPSGFSGGLNFYAYANGNPVSYLDPFGLGAVSENTSSSWVSTYNNIASVVVPGQVAWNNAMSAYQNGNYLTAALDTANMVGQQVLFVMTLGASSQTAPALNTTESTVSQVADTTAANGTATATVTTANLSGATISVSGGVANVSIEYGATPLSQLANAVANQAAAMGATTVVVDTGIVADEALAESLAARAASGGGFLGGTVQAVGSSSAPRFIITIPLKR